MADYKGSYKNEYYNYTDNGETQNNVYGSFYTQSHYYTYGYGNCDYGDGSAYGGTGYTNYTDGDNTTYYNDYAYSYANPVMYGSYQDGYSVYKTNNK